MILSKIITCGTIAVTYSLSNSLKAKVLVDCHDCNMKRLPKARELPLYEKDEENFTVEYDEQSKLPLTSEISGLRVQVSGIASYLNTFKEQAVHIYETGVAHSQSTYDYITSKENRIPRILAIFSGGLLGIIFARKGGYIKKTFYGSIGSGLVCTAFYPSESKEYFVTSFEFTKHHVSEALEKYGGYDAQKLAEKTNEKIEYVKNTLNIEDLSKTMKEWLEKNKETVSKTLSTVTGNNSVNKEKDSDKASN
ncbi:MICOS complex subunit [Trichonephila inaurata madagascariensis]|uniref:MICOS complex subunit n=1 Tax=Trichonephila inaurata madagascariensis TaxID=2747483 RepID=A0A8X6XLJ8_9ARAC|nr:MICOS complex subunit [Trichonephila inaurata madagascariensis]